MKRFAKLRLLAGMALLLGMTAAVIVCASPYAPAVEAAPENIEEIWAIEDTRTESEAPLVTMLKNHGQALAYDRENNTFYCTLGMDVGDTWPDISLTAPDARGMKLCFVDDYSYDWCSDAVMEGYAYQALAYTDTAFSYFDIVFTGLPIVQLQAEDIITELDTPAQFTMSMQGEAELNSPARVHLRGDRSLTWKPKGGYRVEFTRGGDSGKVLRSVPGLCDTQEALLLPIAIDGTMMRDRLSWDVVRMAFDEDEGFGALPNEYVEVFVDGRYEGVYLMLKPYDIGDEMRKEGQETIFRDSLYRVTRMEMAKDRPVMEDPTSPEAGFELFYAPSTAHGFDALAPYIDLITEENDAEFARKAMACLDLDSLLRYTLIMQAGCMVDNASNNLYIWAHRERDGIRYRFAFWDMDLTWGQYAGDEGERWVELAVADRVIALDVGGARARTQQIWAQLKDRGFTAENIEQLITQYVHELGDSGAYARDSERWEKGDFYPDGYEIVSFAYTRFEMMDAWVDSLVQ
ncbi:MAG: CotH kinase family protein [Clostridia bacterium]|nr:CotH kinase family protein [Clostridia bacterium]